MTTRPPEGDFPPVHPGTSSQTQFVRPEWLTSLPNFIQHLIENFLGVFLQGILGSFIPGPLGTAFNQLVNWATNLLPAQILEPFEELVEALVSLLGHIPIVGPIISQLVDIFGFMDDNTTNAQGSADNANTGVAQLNAQLAAIIAPPGGVSITDNFDRTGADLGTNWFWEYSGAGAGSLETNGNDAFWDPAGGASRIVHAIHDTALATDDQMCSIVQGQKKNASNTDPDLRLILRSDATLDNFVLAIIRHDEVEVGYVVSGTYTRLGAIVSQTTANGDRWEFRAGTATDERQFLLYRNDALVCDRTDSGDVSQMGASFRQVGFGGQAGVHFIFGFGFQQMAHPNVQGFAAADRAA